MFSLIKFVFFILTISSFGFILLNRLAKVRSIILLLPLSISLGIASYIFSCHLLAFLVGPKIASVLSIFIFFTTTILLLFTTKKNGPYLKNLHIHELEISKKETKSLILLALMIIVLSFFALNRFGGYDKFSHYPMALTIYHNNVYPPRDPFRPEYVLLYHYGGDLLAGAVHNFCNLPISTSFELILTICSGVTFLSLFALAWLLTKSFKLSLICGFCTYFGGGLLWLDAIIRYLWKIFPPGVSNWGFLQTFFNLGLHGGITDAPSVVTFVPTYGLGYPTLILCLIMFWKMIQEEDFIVSTFYLILLNVCLLSLFLTTDWLYMTFWGAVLPLSICTLFLKKQKQIILPIIILLITSILINKSIGNALFLQDEIQNLGRANIFDIRLKEKLFWVMSWRILNQNIGGYQSVYLFSWDFICEFGLSLLLLPIAIGYLIKTKNKFALLLFFSALFTVPIPLLLDFKLNPAELDRLFNFGNTMIILLITCGIGILFKSFFERKAFLFSYLTAFCLSPFIGLVLAAVFTPNIYSDRSFVQMAFKSFQDSDFSNFNEKIIKAKNKPISDYKSELEFLKKYTRPKDVAISNLYEVPAYAGVYSLIPSGRYGYWDQLYSMHNTIFQTIFSTLDPYLLNELNIKWIIVTNTFKNNLSQEAKDILNNLNICSLLYKSPNKKNKKLEWLEIYYVKDDRKILDHYKRKTAWLLIDKNGLPIGTTSEGEDKITLFDSIKNALAYLKYLQNIRPDFKKQLITAQTIDMRILEQNIKNNMSNVRLEYQF